ncbi:hypothetical protein E8L99_16805 [Phreatobacter aquaticus]|uniref:Uncharacterized protein n=1 Tax=Phreatobacter aquaticus TaxID=2570229 RepID=A0A4D7QQW6_9HYPH|nr:hypothetical protein [Phreatobacter aquaticus]QCK87297.1 hypothetical protein E8L99_16805 [Phreatobacter aquaticus]
MVAKSLARLQVNRTNEDARLFNWYMPRFTEAAWQAASVSASAAMAASLTIAHRMTMLADPSAMSDSKNHAEAMRMVTEKMDAAAEGSFAAAAEASRFVMRSAMGQVSPDDIAHGLMKIGVAATKPATRKVKANARRLSAGG